jgi:hypothetical protein
MELSFTALAIIAVILVIIMVLSVMDLILPLQVTEGKGCDNEIAINASQGR